MKRILIVEDDPCTRMIYCAKLQAEGFEAEPVGDGHTAIERLKSSPPDLIVLDLMLPQISGFDVLKFLRAQASTKTLPAIVLSNAYEHSRTAAAYEAGASLCLCKTNCNPRNLVSEVRKLLAGAPTEATVEPKAQASVVAVPQADCSDVDPDMMDGMPERIVALGQSFQHLGKSDETSRPARLLDLQRDVHGIVGAAALAGLTHMAQLSCALEALLGELHAKPQKINPSALRTVAQAVDLLICLSENADVPQNNLGSAPRILVVDDEPISRHTICTALKKANLPATAIEDPLVAMSLLMEKPFDLIFLDVEMPGLNGFDVCTKLRATAENATTPVVFVTALSSFEARARSSLSGGTDIIAKPVLLIELAVKALIHLFRPRVNPSASKVNGANVKQTRAVPSEEVKARLALV